MPIKNDPTHNRHVIFKGISAGIITPYRFLFSVSTVLSSVTNRAKDILYSQTLPHWNRIYEDGYQDTHACPKGVQCL
jgi:hypothetical protein